jgi:hypothetical protein
MKKTTIALFLLITLTSKAQQLVLNDGLKPEYVQEAVLPVSNNAYVLVRDSTAYLYNTTGTLPYKKQKLNDSYILNTSEDKLYSINLVPQYVDQIDDDTQEITTLVTYVYNVMYNTLDNVRTNELKKLHGHFIPKTAVPESFSFDDILTIEDTYATSIYQESHASLPSHYLKIDKNNILAIHANGGLVLTEVKNHKVTRKKSWAGFNVSIHLINCIKIGDFARIKFQRYNSETDKLEDFWSIINLKTQAFVPIDLKEFNANLANLQEQDAGLLNSVQFFYKGTDNSNIWMFVLPNKNFVWLDDESYYYGSDDLSKYATMQKEDKSFSLNAHAYIYNHPSRILRAIAPQEKDRIIALAEIYVKNKHKIELEHNTK